MKILVINSKDDINILGENEEFVHLTFRPSNKDILILIQAYENLKAIHIPSSFKNTISKSTRMLLEMEGISILEGDVWGHRSDINEYYEIKPQIINLIEKLRSEGQSDEEIIYQLGKKTRLGKDLITFLVHHPNGV